MTPVWTPRALEDIAEVISYLAAENLQAADDLLARSLDLVEGTLVSQPNVGRPGRVEGTREAVVSPSYILVYRVTAHQIEILAFRHTSRLWPDQF
ncbi:type II toxin-antitoxin system RelE/ParE family toxin [Shimia aestuarii]|uniref:Addiction module toxin, RelE/StbE family n=1 Tax=Shimia aestuarii TaxID=254406 RepID=A0A1I4T7Z2_9RHOB|nr:type II toxin-antitoxin system RelE/ParE family toxin [Shimia aestuarii]SFM72680.1 addiction module toxin, RelE/StbE family [Shimia aestuarii]